MNKHNDLTFFTNEPGSCLYDRFKSTLESAKYFDALVGYFRTSGFYRLYDAFDNVEKIRILVGINTDYQTYKILQDSKQLNYLESHANTKKIYSEAIQNEFVESEDNFNVELGVKKFKELLKAGKIEIKAFPSREIHAKVYISRYDSKLLYGSVVTGSSNFSESGLNGNYEFNVELKNKADVDYALEKFEYLWNQGVDLSEEYIETVNTKTWLNDEITPYELYLKFLYEYFNEDINAEQYLEIDLPDNFMKLKYQTQAIASINKIVESYNGVFISDVVGLGKTYIAAMYAQDLKGKKLVIAPPPIMPNWEQAFKDFGVKKADIVSSGMLHKIVDKIEKTKENEYDYIFVDEAHRFRTEETEQYTMLRRICFNKKVILITATPLNNSFYDFYPLISLFQKPTDSDIPGERNIKHFFTQRKTLLSQVEKARGKDSVEYLNAIKNVSKEVRDKILSHIMLRRTRTDIVNYFSDDMKEQGLSFPKVAPPEKIIYEFDSKTNFIFEDTIDTIKTLTYARYTPLLYLDEQLSAFETTQQSNMKGFIKSRLVKRLESSKYAFEKTIERFIESHKRFIEMYESGTVYISKKVNVYDYIDNENEEELEKLLIGGNQAKVKKYSSDQFREDFIINLKGDLAQLEIIFEKWKSIPKDFKQEKFLSELKSNKLLANNKLIIFTESKETGENLIEALNKEYKDEVIFYSSGQNEKIRDKIKYNFDQNNNYKEDEIRILITTDVLAEGINLHRSNIVINYDLPWNPTRVMQRVGRVNRVGSEHEKIHIFNFFPTAETDAELGLEDNIIAKIQAFHNALGEDAQYLSDTEEFTSFNLDGTRRYYKKMNSAETFENDGEENIELKYLKVIRDLRDKNTDLYCKIKTLPKKIRTGKLDNNVKKDSLITFFRKGKLKKFCITQGLYSEELAFDEAVIYYECEENSKKQDVPKEYYEYLEINRNLFEAPSADAVPVMSQRGGKSNEKEVISILKSLQRDARFTQEELEYINLVLKAFNDGLMPKKIAQKLKKQIEVEVDNLKILPILRHNIPNEFIYENTRTKDNKKLTREIVLSEFLIRSNS